VGRKDRFPPPEVENIAPVIQILCVDWNSAWISMRVIIADIDRTVEIEIEPKRWLPAQTHGMRAQFGSYLVKVVTPV
jgi:hypothetical protein